MITSLPDISSSPFVTNLTSYLALHVTCRCVIMQLECSPKIPTNTVIFFYLNGMTTKRMGWVGNVTRTRDANRILACKPEENEQPGIVTHTWGNNIKMDVKTVAPKVYSAEPQG